MELNVKNFAMALAATAVQACYLLAPPMPMGDSRLETGGNSRKKDAGDMEKPDTAIYVSAVRAWDGHDWQRDTAYGASGCELVLYRTDTEAFADEGAARRDGGERLKFEVLISFLCGREERVSAAPDLHHIIGGHLFTEYSDALGTTVRRDGEELFSFPEQEILTGLLDTAGHVHTLGRGRDGQGFTYRIDGKPVLAKDTGTVFGDFDSISYGSGGSLYSSYGKVCFAYRQTDGMIENVFLVRDGVPSLLCSSSATTTLDAKILDGEPYLLVSHMGRTLIRHGERDEDVGFNGLVEYSAAELAAVEGRAAAVGWFSISGRYRCCGWVWPGGDGLADEESTDMYWSGGKVYFLNPEKTEGLYMASHRCGDVTGGSLMVALTPRDGGAPMLSWKGRKVEIPMNGFLSGIAVVPPP